MAAQRFERAVVRALRRDDPDRRCRKRQDADQQRNARQQPVMGAPGSRA
jgi:hypothetical protein